MRSIVASFLGVAVAAAAVPAAAIFPVAATVETEPAHGAGDAADDCAIWIHPTDPSLSTVIATDKTGGLMVYDLAGHEIQYLPDGEMNNVDLRYNFPLGGEAVTLVTAGNRSNDTIAIYKVDAAARTLEPAAARSIPVGITETYGSCMYHSPATGKYYFIVNDKDGDVEQWELVVAGSFVDASPVRSFSVGSITEGCVADDELQALYIAEENVGIWRYGAEPASGDARVLVDDTGPSGHLTADVEGLSIYYTSAMTGYLLASCQGNSSFAVYRRESGNAYLVTFVVEAGETIDAVSGTDGIDVTNFGLGAAFPQGLFVAQDGRNESPSANQNFKFVPWQEIANNPELPLVVDTSWDPRAVGTTAIPVRPWGTIKALHR